MTLLAIVNEAQAALNLPVTTTVFSNTGQTQRQLLNLCNIEGRELADEYAWQALVTETSFTTTATEEQTHSSADLPADLGWIIDETLYNRTAVLRIIGPLGAREWQDQKAFGAAGADSQYRIRGNSFWILPAPTASQSVYYEYVSNKWVQNAAGSTNYTGWQADTDVGRIPEHLLTLGLIWRWKAAKGFDFSKDEDAYLIAKGRKTSRDGTRRKLSAVGPQPRSIGRGRVPEGSWG